jgi:hypothetical protein
MCKHFFYRHYSVNIQYKIESRLICISGHTCNDSFYPPDFSLLKYNKWKHQFIMDFFKIRNEAIFPRKQIMQASITPHTTNIYYFSF